MYWKLEKIIEQKTADDPAVELFRTIPGAGIITAAPLRARIDDIDRFDRPEQPAACSGVVPRVQTSDESVRYGQITNRGPSELRTAVVQAVSGMVRMKRTTGSWRIMIGYDRMKRETGSGRSIISTARLLSEIIWPIPTNIEPFDPLRMTDSEVRPRAREMRAAVFNAA